ncbi:MAG: hypothetical protein JWO85_2251 [Candidatus Eremiobacteraeota bacterium]|nr:hypothetical protein [Candidatus Eremiobacteraeota bacterium]
MIRRPLDGPPSIDLFSEARCLLEVVGPLTDTKFTYLAECGRVFDLRVALDASDGEYLAGKAAHFRHLIDSALRDPDKLAYLLASSEFYDVESTSSAPDQTTNDGEAL